MRRQFLLWLSVAFMAFTIILVVPDLVNGQIRQKNLVMMNNAGMGDDVQTIHQLFIYHAQIHRRIEQIPGGIRTVTESDNPQVVALIQAHVSRMYERVNQHGTIPMMGMSSTLPTMIQAADQYQRQLHLTQKGVAIVETSDNPEMIKVIREHGQEVSLFVERGMPAMMDRMIK
jgi:hypothetical protein